MKTPVRRCSCAQKCISGSRLGWFLRWVLLVGSLGCVGGSFSVPLSPCCLDALNYCPSGCHSVNFRPIASDNNLCHGAMEKCGGVSCCSVEATGPDGLPLSAPVPYLQLGKHAVGLPTCDSGCNAVFLTNVGLPTIVSHNLSQRGPRPPVGLDSLPLLNSSAFEFSLLFDMVVELSGPEWGPRFGKCYLAGAFFFSSWVVLKSVVVCLWKVFKKKWRKLRRKKQKVRQKHRAGLRRNAQTPTFPKQLVWLRSARKYGSGNKRQVRFVGGRLKCRVRTRRLRLARRCPSMSAVLVRRICKNRPHHECRWLGFLPRREHKKTARASVPAAATLQKEVKSSSQPVKGQDQQQPPARHSGGRVKYWHGVAAGQQPPNASDRRRSFLWGFKPYCRH